jgi:glycosyltransferase involved in cell wall biosynthesis
MENPLISVFTPTYNRSATLYRVWDSLIAQTYQNFEWVIIDDGSSDDIVLVVQAYIEKANFPIIFHKFPSNLGKHNATNKALELANGKFFIVADSDDAFTPDALAVFNTAWQEIADDEKKDFCGVRACCQDQFGNRISDILAVSPFDMTMADAFYIHNFRKESWCMVLTEWHRNFLFPTNHKGYYPEGIIWKAMSRTKKLRFLNNATRMYYVENDNNSIMRQVTSPQQKISRNIVVTEDTLNNDFGYFLHDPKYFAFTAVLFTMYSCYEKKLVARTINLQRNSAKLLVLFLLLPSFIVFFLHKLKYEQSK